MFTTTALQQAKVDLTWDTTNPNRAEAIKSALDGKIDDLDLKEYLASSSEGNAQFFINIFGNIGQNDVLHNCGLPNVYQSLLLADVTIIFGSLICDIKI